MGDSLPGDGRGRTRGELAPVLTAKERAALKKLGAVPMRDPEEGIRAGGIEWRDPTGNEAAARVDKMREWLAAGLSQRQAYTLMASRLGWKQREIAARVGISRDAVGTAIRSARKKLEKVGNDVHKMSS
jgi:DNA-directed RNA polymerase specialized sigma24 family protein